MKIANGRGVYKKEIAEQNKKAVYKWFKENPESTITECYRALKLSYPTVRKNLNALIEEHEAINGPK